MTNKVRSVVAALSLCAVGLVSLLSYEGFEPVAKPPVKGDVPTYGYGTTTHPDGSPIKLNETITPPKALERALQDIRGYEGALKKCVKVPLFQYEYNAYVSLEYNIGKRAFCNSTLVKKLNKLDYPGACGQILVWDKFKGKPLKGLTYRRQKEYKMCMGQA